MIQLLGQQLHEYQVLYMAQPGWLMRCGVLKSWMSDAGFLVQYNWDS